ncbi:hypothetical protein D9M73_167480 [compost metagenome]
MTKATIMNSDSLPTVENTSPELTVPLTAMPDSRAMIPIPRMSSTISTPKISWAKRSFFIFRSLSALTMMVVEEMARIAPRNSESMVLQPNQRPISKPIQIISTISRNAAINAVAPTLNSLRRLNSRPRQNIRKITPSSASVLIVSSS